MPSCVLWSQTSRQAIILSLCHLRYTNPFSKSKTHECYNSERSRHFFTVRNRVFPINLTSAFLYGLAEPDLVGEI